MIQAQPPLRSGERLDDLLTHQLRIIQSKQVFSFSMDAVLLARFCKVPAKGRILDLCSGNGVIPLLLSTRTKARITGVELQEKLWDMARRSVEWNKLQEQIEMVCADVRDYYKTTGYGTFDLVTMNPPYMRPVTGEANVNPHVAAARHELNGGLHELIAACARHLKSGGKASIVHRPGRLADIMEAMRSVRLEPKRIRFVHPRVGEEANMVLVEATRDGKPDIRLLPPVIVYGEDGQYTKELWDIYYGEQSSLTGGENP
ncbi:methyltransferase [Xylanibacillus composti]|uniref:Methyltransferase n=1 Tax=Xylanibacillus composti TaxID=1572762 RepID=A0A8J4H0C7_9BACL|nr:methyltransferase [Xylanibacillus composti]